jgi:hypothetical protein
MHGSDRPFALVEIVNEWKRDLTLFTMEPFPWPNSWIPAPITKGLSRECRR